MALQPIESFNQLYRSYYAALCYFSLKIVGDSESARDIVEEVFVQLISSKREFTESDNLKAWLYTATRNASLNHLKKEKHLKERQFEFSIGQENEEPTFEYEMLRTEVFKKVLLEIKQLPGHSGKIIEMSYLGRMKNEQIALELGLSEKTVKNLKSSGLAMLKSRLPLDLFLTFVFLTGSVGDIIANFH